MDRKSIERKIVELRFRERELIESRNKARAVLLYNAEKLPLVNGIIDEFFVRKYLKRSTLK